jgi:hypothetical protein
MSFRSPYPDADIPSVCLTEFVLDAPDADDCRPALVDGVTRRSLSFGELRTQIRRVSAGLSRRARKGDVVERERARPRVPPARLGTISKH